MTTTFSNWKWKMRSASEEAQQIEARHEARMNKVKNKSESVRDYELRMANEREIWNIHTRRLLKYGDVRFPALLKRSRINAAVTELREAHLNGKCVARMISDAIGENHEDYMKRLEELGESVMFINE